MNGYDFKLNDAFNKNAKVYQTRPMRAAKYEPGMENGFLVLFESARYDGGKFFRTKEEAYEYINAHPTQRIMENGKVVEIQERYDDPMPVLYSEIKDAVQREDGYYLEDELYNHDYLIMERDCWIVEDIIDGSVHTWFPEAEFTFFGYHEDIVFEKDAAGEYTPVTL